MLRLAGQTAKPIGMKIFVDTHGCNRIKKFEIFFNFIFHGQRRALHLVNNITCSKKQKFPVTCKPARNIIIWRQP